MIKNKVAVIFLNYKTWEDTLNEAKEVHDLFDLNWNQIIIIDNNSPNESGVKLKEKAIGDYVFISSDSNKGYAAGNNLGLRYAKEAGYKYGWILNNDIIIEDNQLLDKLLTVLENNKNVAVANPDIYDPKGYLYNRDSVKPSLIDLTIGAFSYRKKGRILEDLGGFGYVYRPQGCCMIVDLEKLEAVDYLDENTFLYCEEPILAERLLAKGWRCACVNSTKVVHNHSYTVKRSIKKHKIISTMNKSYSYYLIKYRKFGLLKRILCLFFSTIKNFVLVNH